MSGRVLDVHMTTILVEARCAAVKATSAPSAHTSASLRSFLGRRAAARPGKGPRETLALPETLRSLWLVGGGLTVQDEVGGFLGAGGCLCSG